MDETILRNIEDMAAENVRIYAPSQKDIQAQAEFELENNNFEFDLDEDDRAEFIAAYLRGAKRETESFGLSDQEMMQMRHILGAMPEFQLYRKDERTIEVTPLNARDLNAQQMAQLFHGLLILGALVSQRNSEPLSK